MSMCSTKTPVSVTIDTNVLEETRKAIGLIPLSRHVEALLKQDLEAKGARE